VWSERRLQEVAVRDLAEQLDRFRALVGRDPTHVDSHQHRHRSESLRSVFLAVARELDVPLRHLDARIAFCGAFYGHDGNGQPKPDAITPSALIELLEHLPSTVTELGCHPGYSEGLKEWYREERVQEVRTLCDPRVRAAVERLGLVLVSYRELARRRGGELVRA